MCALNTASKLEGRYIIQSASAMRDLSCAELLVCNQVKNLYKTLPDDCERCLGRVT